MASTTEEMLALEARVLALAAGDYLDKVDQLRKLLVTEPDSVQRRLLALTAPSIGGDVLAALASALRLGITDAAETLDLGKEAPAVKEAGKAGVPADVRADVGALSAKSAAALVAAKRLIRAGVDPKVALLPVFADANRIRSTLSTATNDLRNAGAVAVSVEADVPMTLEAERDACVHCLRHQGVVTKTGDFPAGLTYGAKPLKSEGRQRCPIHPYCRCRMVPLREPTYAEALRREADRSILRGFALPSESKKARLAATERLLEDGVVAPKSVLNRAKKAVRDGAFPEQATPSSAQR